MSTNSNPFSFGGIVGDAGFCNRTRELRDLTEIMTSAGRCFVYAERRMGKTSLVLRALRKLPKKEFLPVYVDLWPTDGSVSFATAMARAVSEAAETKTSRLLSLAKNFFGQLRPSVSLNDEGKPNLEFGLDQRSLTKKELTDVLNAPQAIATRLGRRVVVVFDEFQQIADFEDDLTERQLRSSTQQHSDVAYLFLGSRKHLLQSMFLDKARPLYRSAAHYPIGAIEAKHWVPFISRRFQKADKAFPKDLIRDLCSRTEGHPFYTQHLCSLVWSMTEKNGQVTEDSLTKSVETLLARESHAYVTLWETLTKNEQRMLRGLAAATSLPKPFSADFTRSTGLRSASNAQRAAESLLSKDVIDREQSSFVITDRFLRLWIQRMS